MDEVGERAIQAWEQMYDLPFPRGLIPIFETLFGGAEDANER